jgi:hypothetical protein
LYYTIQKPKYEAVSTFILEEKSSGGGLAGLASQFGFNVGSLGGSSSIFSGDNILSILKSKKVVTHVLLSPVDESRKDKETLADLYLEFSGLREVLQKKPSLSHINFHQSAKELSLVQDSVLNLIYETVVENNLTTERTSKQGTIIMVQVTAANRDFARLMTEKLVAEASKLYLDIRVGTAQENIRQLQRRSDSLLSLLNRKSFAAAAVQPLDINPGIKTAIVPVEIANRDKTVLATLYAEVTKNLEASKLLLSQQMPVIQSLDKPGHLLKDKRKGLVLLLLAGSIGAAFFSVLVVFVGFQFLLKKQPNVNQPKVKILEPAYESN